MRETGLEPARRKAYAPKAYVYTNFTTRARRNKLLSYENILSEKWQNGKYACFICLNII